MLLASRKDDQEGAARLNEMIRKLEEEQKAQTESLDTAIKERDEANKERDEAKEDAAFHAHRYKDLQMKILPILQSHQTNDRDRSSISGWWWDGDGLCGYIKVSNITPFFRRSKAVHLTISALEDHRSNIKMSMILLVRTISTADASPHGIGDLFEA